MRIYSRWVSDHINLCPEGELDLGLQPLKGVNIVDDLNGSATKAGLNQIWFKAVLSLSLCKIHVVSL